LLPGSGIIEGEIVEPVDKKLLKSLDRLEGYNKGSSNNLYVRELRNILTEDGEEVPCWIYIYANESMQKKMDFSAGWKLEELYEEENWYEWFMKISKIMPIKL